MTELTIRPRRTPAAGRFDAHAATLQHHAAGDHRLARRYRTRQRVAPTLPCQRHDPELWFADTPTDLEQAKALCAACPIRLTCLAVALDSQEHAGVWGGQLFDRGRIIPHKRPRGRPRKHHVTPEPRPPSHDEAIPTKQTCTPPNTPQNRVLAAIRRLHDAESAVYAAHQSHIDASITAANTKLRDAATEYLAATTAQNPAA